MTKDDVSVLHLSTASGCSVKSGPQGVILATWMNVPNASARIDTTPRRP